MTNNTYDPLWVVHQTHKILHLDSQLAPVSNEFNITLSSYWNDYSQSLLPIPLLCMTLGLIAVIVLQISLCARICFKVCQCSPRAGEENASLVKTHLPKYQGLSCVLIASGMLTVLTVQVLFIGRSNITNGVHQSEDAVNYVSNVFNDLVTYGDTLTTYGLNLESDFQSSTAAGCSVSSTLGSYIPTYNSYVSDYSSYVDPVPGQLSGLTDKIDLWGIKYQNYTIWALYFIIILGLVFFAIGYWRKSKIVMKLGIGVTEVILIILFIITGVEMIVLMAFADFCMDPVTYALPLVPSDVYNLTSYYTTCTGVNPVASIVTESESFLSTYQQAVEGAITVCPGDQYLAAALTTIKSAEVILTNITTEISCPPTQSQLVDLLQSGLCDQTFKGFYVVWIGQYISAGLLLFTAIIISIIYQYFGAYWNNFDEPIRNTYYDYGENADEGVATTRVINPALRQHNNATEDYNF